MIEAALSLLRLLGGLAALCCLGSGLLAALLPQPREFRVAGGRLHGVREPSLGLELLSPCRSPPSNPSL